MEEIKYRISAYSVTSVVVTELILRFVMDNTTIQNDLNSLEKNRLPIHQQYSRHINRISSNSSEQEYEHISPLVAMNGEIWNSKNGTIRVFEKYGVVDNELYN